MTNEEKAAFAVVIASTAELYGKTLTDAALELWWNALADLDLEDIKQGVSRHLRDAERGKFMPMPADVRYSCGYRRPNALVAWGEVLDTMESHGAYRSILFQDGVINAVIRDMGGWPEVCHRQATDEDPVWVQKDFEKRYEQYMQSGRIGKRALIGLSDESNMKHGYLGQVQKEAIYIESSQTIPKNLLIEPTQSLLSEGETSEIDAIAGKLIRSMGEK